MTSSVNISSLTATIAITPPLSVRCGPACFHTRWRLRGEPLAMRGRIRTLWGRRAGVSWQYRLPGQALRQWTHVASKLGGDMVTGVRAVLTCQPLRLVRIAAVDRL